MTTTTIKCEYQDCYRKATMMMYFRVWDINKRPLPDSLVQPYRHICDYHWKLVARAVESVGDIEQ